MKKVLSFEDMSQVSGGKFWDGFCVAIEVGTFAAPLLAITGIGLAILVVADVGCLVYDASNL